MLVIDPGLRLQEALDVAYGYLGRRDRTVVEVRRQLEHKRIEPDTIEATVAELQRQGYLDDQRYAQRFIEDRRALDDWGSERIARKLHGAGVHPDVVEATLADRGTDDEHAAALEALRRRFRNPPAGDRDRERALGFLVRKGYALELSYDVVRAYGREA